MALSPVDTTNQICQNQHPPSHVDTCKTTHVKPMTLCVHKKNTYFDIPHSVMI